MRGCVFIVLALFVLSGPQFAVADWRNIPDIKKKIELQESAIKSATSKIEAQKKIDEAKRKADDAARKAAEKARAEALARERAEAEKRAMELDDMKRLREMADSLIKRVEALASELNSSNTTLKETEARLKAQEDELENERKIFSLQEENLKTRITLFEAERDKEGQSTWNWIYGFMAAVGTAVIGLLGMWNQVLESAKQKLEINKLKLEVSELRSASDTSVDKPSVS